MEQKNQVVSLEYAKKMKELRFEQESYFYWVNDFMGWTIRDKQEADCIACEDVRASKLSAYTVAELGEMLPYYLWVDEPKSNPPQEYYYDLKITKTKTLKYIISYAGANIYHTELPHQENDFSEADARAKMLIYLKENKLI